jgi:hypothetical protein
MLVYVLDINGCPLMPTSRFGKVRRLLRDNQAKVVRKEPFTIQLFYETEKIVDDLTLGVDTGSSMIGTAVVNSEEEVFYIAETKIRNDITKKIKRRSIARQLRRSRKLRYRKPRFDNRKNSKRKDRFSPTMVSKISSHIREIEFVKSILPIKQVVIESNTFDPHLLKMIEEGKPFNKSWGYQKGPNYGFENAKAACLNRDNYTCQHCKTKKGTLHAHHIVYKRNDGADTLDNLITLCEKCHKDLHDGKLITFESKLKGKRKGDLKHATQMNSIRAQLLKYYPDAIETFGYVTKTNRQAANLEKSHYIDAIVIACGSIPKPKIKCNLLQKRHIAHGEYQLHQGQRSEKKLPRGKVFGFNLNDKVQYFDKVGFIQGRLSTGYAILKDIFDNKLDFSYLGRGLKTPKMERLKKINSIKTTQVAIHILS